MREAIDKKSGLIHYHADYWTLPTRGWPVHPFCVEEAERAGATDYHDHTCPYLCIIIITEGSLIYRCDGGPEIEVGKGQLFVIPEGSSYSFHSAEKPYYRKLVLEVKGVVLKAIAESLSLDRSMLLEPEDCDSLVGMIRQLGELLKLGRIEDVPVALGLTQTVLSSISMAACKEPKGQLLLERAKAKLEFGFEQNIGIPELAAELGICQSLLGRRFKQEFGVSPREYRISRRIEAAKTLLENTSMTIKEIARQLGYANQLYFANDFRKRCGVQPSAYRKSNETPK